MPSLLANVPEGIVWGRVTAYVTSFVADGGTELPDGTPDAIPLDGTITLTPTVGVMVFPTLTTPQQAVIQSLVCPVIGGVLYTPGTTPENVGGRDPGVILVASEQPLGQPDRVQYNVTWALEGARVSPPPVTIDVPSQATVDLATVIPATPGPGKVIVVSTVDRERAEDAAAAAANSAGSAFDDAAIAQGARLGAEAARDAAEAAADTAETAATVAVTAKNLAEGFAGDAETARDQVVTARDETVTARNQAVTARSETTTARDETVTARNQAVTAREDAETASSQAVTARNEAVTAKHLAEGFATAAASSATAAQTAAAALQDTGWRNIATILDPEMWSITTARLRRHGSLVTFTAQITALKTNASYTPLLIIPSGFRLTQKYVWLNPISTTNSLATIRITNRLDVEGSVAKDTVLRIQSSWTTSDEFPTLAGYPGTPA